MRCPICGCVDDKVLDTRPIDDNRGIRRRRECLNCHHRFTSHETVEKSALIVCKRDNTHEIFNRDKILTGITKACQKRPVSARQILAVVDSIEADLQNDPRSEIPSVEIGEKIMEHLRDLDDVAYIRFASVYREFDDLESFIIELDKLKKFREEKDAEPKNKKK